MLGTYYLLTFLPIPIGNDTDRIILLQLKNKSRNVLM